MTAVESIKLLLHILSDGSKSYLPAVINLVCLTLLIDILLAGREELLYGNF